MSGWPVCTGYVGRTSTHAGLKFSLGGETDSLTPVLDQPHHQKFGFSRVSTVSIRFRVRFSFSGAIKAVISKSLQKIFKTRDQISNKLKPGIEQVQILTDISRLALCCHSNEVHEPIANLPKAPFTHSRMQSRREPNGWSGTIRDYSVSAV